MTAQCEPCSKVGRVRPAVVVLESLEAPSLGERIAMCESCHGAVAGGVAIQALLVELGTVLERADHRLQETVRTGVRPEAT
jgi:hypothetical protein